MPAAWWRHRALRRCGEIEEAQRLERATIRRDLGYLRKALNNPNAYVSCGGGGTILHLGLTTVSLYAPAERFLLAHMAVRLGVPLVDTRPIEDVIALANLPRVAINDRIDPEPWGHRKVSTVVPKISNALDLTPAENSAISRDVSRAIDRISRKLADVISWPGRWNKLAIGSSMETERCRCLPDLNLFIILSRRRVG